MDNARINKIEKAKRYAEERDRFQFIEFEATIQGDNSTHSVIYKDGKFESSNEFFNKHGYSAHTMAMERILKDMIPSPAESESGFVPDSTFISKVEKAKRYAQDPTRIQFISFTASVRGDNGTHIVTYKDGKFESDNEYFKTYGYSAHTIAIERLLQGMVASPAEQP